MSSTLHSLLQQTLRVRPDEARRTGLSCLYLFSAIGAFIVARMTRDSLMLEIPDYKAQLPLVYVGLSVTVSLIMFSYTKVERKLRRDRTNIITLVSLLTVFFFFRTALNSQSYTVYWAFYVWVEIFGAFIVLQFWTFTTEIFHARQAKRVFAVIGGAGMLANIAFGGLVKNYVNELGTHNLIYVIMGCLTVCLFAVHSLGRQARAELEDAHQRHPASSRQQRMVGGQKAFVTRHVQFIALAVMLTYVVNTLVDYQFKVIVGDSISEMNGRTQFFGAFYLYTGILGSLIQFGVTSRLLERFGVLPALMLLPCSMMFGSFALLLPIGISSLWAVTFAKGSEPVLRYTVTDATMQLLYLPVPAHIRGRVKATIDGILKYVAQGFAGLLLSVLVGTLSRHTGIDFGLSLTPNQLSGIVCFTLVLWMLVLFRLRDEYIKSLMKTLQKRRLNFRDASFQITDEGTIRTLQRALKSESLGEVLDAIELLPSISGKAQGPLNEAVAALLDHRSEEVRMAALRYLQNHNNLNATKVVELLEDKSPAVRAAAVLCYCSLQREKAIVRAQYLLEDLDKKVRAATVAGLIRYGGLDGVLAAADALKEMLRSPSQKTREYAAWTLGEVGVENFYQPLIPLLDDPAENVRTAAIEAAGRLKNHELIPKLVEQLDHPRLAVTVVKALSAFGDSVSPYLATIFDDLTRPRFVRAHLARVFARLDTPQSAEILCEHLSDQHIQVRGAAATALIGITSVRPGLPINHDAIDQALRSEARNWFHMLSMLSDVCGDDDVELLAAALRERQESMAAQILRLLALKYPTSTIELVQRNLQSQAIATRANAIEVLDNLLSKEDKEILLPILEEGPIETRLAVGREEFGLKSHPKRERVKTLLNGTDDWLQACAAMAVARGALIELDAEVATLLKSETALCRETALMTLTQIGCLKKYRKQARECLEDSSIQVRRYAEFVLEERSENSEKVVPVA